MAARSNGGNSAGREFRFEEMTRTERVMAAVRGEPVDRLPICFWHHFRPEGSGRQLAEASLRFFDETFDLDIVKVMPDIPYPFPRRSISTVDGWRLIEPIDADRSRFFQQRAECVRVLRDELGFDTPIIVTVFSPLCEALYFAESRERFFEHAAQSPSVIHEALSIIATNLRDHIRDVIDAGADGVFFALQGATRAVMTEEQYREFGRPYDLIALQGAVNGWLNVLHIHGEKDLHFELVLDYPVQVLNWSDRLAGPSLREARTLTSKCLMGGWHEFGAIANGPEDKILEEARDAVAQTGGRKFILANGCSVPDETDERWLHAARDAVEQIELE
ncbi:MAG TPA: uroporphyrinogen decarboxylase family protein [Thermomicrobiales bacterium]